MKYKTSTFPRITMTQLTFRSPKSSPQDIVTTGRQENEQARSRNVVRNTG